MEDSKLIEMYFSRDEDAILRTDEIYGGRLFCLSKNIVRSELDAQECVNDTYVKTWDSIPPRRPERFFAYIAKICRNISLGRLDWEQAAKRKAEVVALTQEMESCIPDAQQDRKLEGKELGRILDTFLRTLTSENRVVFMRRYWYVDTIAEIAERYSISESAVQMRLNRTRNKLRVYLEKEGIRV